MILTGKCEICDSIQRVEFALVRWKVRDSYHHENLARCVDRRACRARVESSGHEWAIEDLRPG